MTWPLVTFLLLPALTRAETAVQAWVQRYNGPGDGNDYAVAVAVDGNNDVIVTGYSTNSASRLDYATIKYSSAGVALWTNRYNGLGNGNDYAVAVAVDGNNDVIVTGYSTNSASGYGYGTIKYSSAGVPLWTNRYNGPVNGNDQAVALAVDSSNNVIVTGYSVGSLYDYDYATIKYSSEGVPLWTNRYNGPWNGPDYANAVAVDGSNNVIVTGWSTGSGGVTDYATIKYSSEGVPVWTNRYNRSVNYLGRAYAVVVDGINNVIVTGKSMGALNNYDYATIKYSSAGVPLWTNRYNGPGNFTDQATAVAVDRNDNVIVTGFSQGSGSGVDYATIKYSSPGVPLWTNRYNGPANGGDLATSLAVDHSGNVIVTGYSIDSASGYDFATIKYICVPSPVVTGLQLTNGAFQMRVDNVLQPGTLVIEASTNLAGWAPVFTNTMPTNVLFYTDPDAGNSLTRFYRAFQFP
jgi:uncharacterized delta-60 repeat protein